MTREEKLEFYTKIRESAIKNPDVKQAISDKNHALSDLKKSQYASYQKPAPQLKPPGSPPNERFEKKKLFSDEVYEQKRQEITKEHDEKIHQEVKRDLNNKAEYDQYEQIDELGAEKTGILMDDDGAKNLVDLEEKEQKALEQDKAAEVDKQQDKETIQPNQDKRDKEMPLDRTESFHDNKETIERDNREAQDYRLDDTQMDNLLNESRDYEMDDLENSKSIDKDVDRDQDISHDAPDAPDPGDDYE